MEQKAVLLLLILHYGYAQDWEMVVNPHVSMTVPLGTDTMFVCSALGLGWSTSIKMKWYNPMLAEVPQDASQRVFSRTEYSDIYLYITPMTPNDAGRYTCIVEMEGTSKNSSVHIMTYKGITFTNAPRKQNLLPGTHGLITCEVWGMPRPTVNWYFKGSRLPRAEGRYMYVQEPDGLRIYNVTSADEGEYTCRGEVTHDGRTKSVSIAVTYNKFPPGKPEGVKVIQTTQTSVTLEIQAPESDGGSRIMSYKVAYDSVTTMTPRWRINNPYRLTLENLRPSTEYHVRVQAVNLIGTGPEIQISCTTDDVSVPDRIEVTSSPAGIDHDFYLLTWNLPNTGGLPIKYYMINYQPVGGDKHELRVEDDPSSPISRYRIQNLQANTSYSVWISAINYVGASALSEKFTFRTARNPLPGKPEGITVIQTTPTSVTLEIQAPESDGGSPITSYEVAYDETRTETSRWTMENPYTFTLGYLKPSTDYTVYIQARNSIGTGPTIQISFTTDEIREPGQVEITSSFMHRYPDSYRLQWNRPDTGGLPIKYYSITYQPVGGDKHELRLEDDPSSPMSWYNIQNLQVNTSYSLWISASNDIGSSVPSEEFTFRTARHRRPGQVEITSSPEGSEPDSYLLTWDTPDADDLSIRYYFISLGSNYGREFIVEEEEPPVTSLRMSNLQQNTRYNVSIKATSRAGSSNPNEEFIFRTASNEDS